MQAIAIALKKDNCSVSFTEALLVDMATYHKAKCHPLRDFIEEVQRCCNDAFDPTNETETQYIKNVCTRIWKQTIRSQRTLGERMPSLVGQPFNCKACGKHTEVSVAMARARCTMVNMLCHTCHVKRYE